jgi:membrane protease YdiL (CAAX protease family)
MMGLSIIAVLSVASIAIWCWIVNRLEAGVPLIPLARRRPVPWRGLDVFFIFVLAFLLPIFAIAAANKFFAAKPLEESAEKPAAEEVEQAKKLEMGHPAEDLLGSHDWRMIAAAMIAAVVVAPILEELLFRVVLQGWLESVWSHRRRLNPTLRDFPFSWFPLLMPAALFALIHFRSGREPPSLNLMLYAFIAQIAASLLTLAVVIVVLRFGAGATAADLGWQPKKLPYDCKTAVVALIAVAPPLLLLNGALKLAILRGNIPIAPDPIPLFFLALVFGFLYRRTHRIAPSLLLHMAFNATSVLMFFLVDRQ